MVCASWSLVVPEVASGLPTSSPHSHLDPALPNFLVGTPLTLTPSHLSTSPGGSTESAQVALTP